MSQLRLCKTLICLISVKYLCRTDTDSANLPLVISQGESLPLVNFERSSLNQSTAQSGWLYLMFLKQLQDLADSRACAFSISRQCLILFQTLNLKIKKKDRKQHLAQKQDAHLFSDRVKKLFGGSWKHLQPEGMWEMQQDDSLATGERSCSFSTWQSLAG